MSRGEDRSAFLPAVVVEERESVAVIRFNRPAERNPLSAHVLEQLTELISSISKRNDITGIIFTGSGDAFASGANIRELSGLTPDAARDFAIKGQRLFQLIADAPQLTVAAVNGYCMGGGLDLALACDIRCASPRAVFAHPGARLGIITGWGGTQRLPRLVGSARALEMFLTGRQFNCEEALRFGLADAVDENAVNVAYEIIRSRSRQS